MRLLARRLAGNGGKVFKGLSEVYFRAFRSSAGLSGGPCRDLSKYILTGFPLGGWSFYDTLQ